MKTMIRVNPLRDIYRYNRFYDTAERPTEYFIQFPLDIYEKEDTYTVIASLPGVDADSINIQLEAQHLRISGELVNTWHDEDTMRPLVQERVYGKFQRVLNLPEEINRDGVEASYENGLLTLHLPKKPEVQPRRIAVKAIKNN